MSTIFRLATPADAYEIAVMSRYLIEIGLRGWSWHPERVVKAIRARNTNVLVVEVKANMIGFAIMEFGDTRAHLSLLAVKPTHQRCGIGRQMMAWLEEAALTAGIATIELELRANNFGARSFYHALGYREKTYIAGYYQGAETALRMARDIRRQIPDRKRQFESK
ncbi:MAG: GNAT family N-acetyltransferase [Burkholderiales bacterium]|nr:GNAT family N-acetyltransferase [Burkholderiales bacterium]